MKSDRVTTTIEKTSRRQAFADPERFVRLNRKLIFKLLLVVGGVAVAMHFVHGYQVRQQADRLLTLSEQAKEQGDVQAAIQHLSRYVRFRRGDTQALANLGVLLDQSGKTPREWMRVFLTFEEVLRRESDDVDQNEIRRRIVNVAMRLGRYSDALTHLQELLPPDGDLTETDAEHVFLVGQCYEATGQYSDALRSYNRARQLAAGRIEHYEWLTSLLNRESDRVTQDVLRVLDPLSENVGDDEQTTRNAGEVAERILDVMVSRGKPSYRAFLARARFRMAKGRLPEAEEDVRRAVEEAGYDNDVLLTAAYLAMTQADHATRNGDSAGAEEYLIQAREFADSGLEKEPPDVRFFLIRGRVEFRSVRFGEAIAQFDAGSNAVIETRGRVEEDLREARQRSIHHPDRTEIGEFEGTLRQLERVETELQWSLADALISLAEREPAGLGSEDVRKRDVLMQELRERGAVPAIVDFMDGRIALSDNNWLLATQEFEGCRHAIEDRPELVKRIDLSLGYCYRKLQNPDARLDVFRRALRDDPTWGQGRKELAEALVGVNRIDEAIQEYQLLLGNPGIPTAVARLLMLQQLAFDKEYRSWGQVEQHLKIADEVMPGSTETTVLRAELLALQDRIADAQNLLQRARQEHPDDVTLWTTSVLLALRREGAEQNARSETAQRLLDEARELLGNAVKLQVLQMMLTILGPKNEALEKLALYEQSIADAASPEEKGQLLEGLASAYQALDARDKIREIYESLGAEQPHNILVWWKLAELATQERAKLAAQERDQPTADQALQQLRFEKAKKAQSNFDNALEQMRVVEGIDGPIANYVEAVNLIQKAAHDDQLLQDGEKLAETLETPHALLRLAAKKRPHWPVIPLTLARLEELRSNKGEAIYEYRQAVIRGDNSEEVVQRLVTLLLDEDRGEEAEQELAKYEARRSTLLSSELAQLALKVAWDRRDIQRALGLAQILRDNSRADAVDETGETGTEGVPNYPLLIVETELLRLDGRWNDAKARFEAFFQEYGDAARRIPDTTIAYVAFLARMNDREGALSQIHQAEEQLPKDILPITLAECYYVLGDREEARKYYEQAVEATPDNALIRLRVAGFYAGTGRLGDAQRHLQKILERKTDVPDSIRDRALRTTARIFASLGRIDEARILLGLNRSRGSQMSLDQLRDEATLLELDLKRRVTRHSQQELIAALEQIAGQQPLTPGEQFQLARLYEATGDWPHAREQLLDLVRTNGQTGVFLAHLVQAMVKNGEPADAEPWMQRLVELQPDSFLTATTRAHLLAGQKRPDQAVATLNEYLRKQDVAPRSPELRSQLRELALQGPGKLNEAVRVFELYAEDADDEAARTRLQQVRERIANGSPEDAFRLLKLFLQSNDLLVGVHAGRLRVAAHLIESFGQAEAAEELYEQYVSLSRRPESVLLRAAYLGRQHRIGEALDLCEPAWKTVPVEQVAIVCVSLIRTGSASDADVGRVSAWLDRAVAEHPTSDGLLIQMAALFDYQQRHEQAAAVYRKIIDRNDKQIQALNNLAWLLAVTSGNGTDALSLINRAIDLAGPLPMLLDTRADAYLANGEPAKAVDDLERAVREAPTGDLYFHLAKAHAAARNLTAAKEAYRKATASGFSPERLHPLEMRDFENFKTALARKSQ